MTTLGSTLCLVVAAACLSGGTLSAQETGTDESPRHGGFGGPVVKFTEVDDRFGVLVGGHGGWILDGSWMIGGGGYALANTSNFEHLTSGGDGGALEMAYGGVELAYVHSPNQPVHASVGLLLGAGGLTWTPDDTSGDEIGDGFLVVEPEVEVFVSATDFLRVGLGVSYRIAGGVDSLDLENSDLSGIAAFLTLNFGGF